MSIIYSQKNNKGIHFFVNLPLDFRVRVANHLEIFCLFLFDMSILKAFDFSSSRVNYGWMTIRLFFYLKSRVYVYARFQKSFFFKKD